MTTSPLNTLQTAMLGNALFSGTSATVFWLLRQELAARSNIPQLILEVIALGLLGFAALLVYGALGRHRHQVGLLAVGLDWAWVVGSAIALLLPITNSARIGLVIIAIVVIAFALWQRRGLHAPGGA